MSCVQCGLKRKPYVPMARTEKRAGFTPFSVSHVVSTASAEAPMTSAVTRRPSGCGSLGSCSMSLKPERVSVGLPSAAGSKARAWRRAPASAGAAALRSAPRSSLLERALHVLEQPGIELRCLAGATLRAGALGDLDQIAQLQSPDFRARGLLRVPRLAALDGRHGFGPYQKSSFTC